MWETVIVHFHYVTGLVFCTDVCWLKINQSIYTREMSFVYFVTTKGTHWDNLCNHHLSALLSLAIQRRERIITVLWTLVKCLLYFATYDLDRTVSTVLSPYRLQPSWSFSSPHPSSRPEDPPSPLPPRPPILFLTPDLLTTHFTLPSLSLPSSAADQLTNDFLMYEGIDHRDIIIHLEIWSDPKFRKFQRNHYRFHFS